MALSAIAITTLAKAKNWLGLSDTTATAFKVYHDATGTPATATVEVTATQLILTSATGAQTQTLTLADAANDTLTELMAVVLPANGWVTSLLYPGDATSTELVPFASTSCLTFANQQTISIMDNRGLEIIIEGVTAEIETWLGRGILSRNYQEVVYLEPGETLTEVVLAQPTISTVERIQVDATHALTVSYTGSRPRATVEVTATGIVTRSQTGGTETATTSLFADNLTLTAMAATIDALTDWTATVPSGTDGNDPTEFMVRTGPTKAKSVNVQLSSWADYDGEWAPDYEAGIVSITPLAWPYSSRSTITASMRRPRFQVWYTAGYTTVPYDVEQVALDMIAIEFNARGADTSLQSENLEGYSYTRRLFDSESSLVRLWQKRLARYQRVLP